MLNMNRRKAVKALTGIAVAGLALGALGISGGPANADPKQWTALTGVGSDTTQDVLNAFAGFSSNNSYLPLQSSLASGKRQLTSWDAVGSPCIVPKPTGKSMVRPNGSSNGRRALSRAIDGGNWPASGTDCGGPKTISGLVDFARSSAGPSGTGTELTYIPTGRDALSFAYYANGVAPVTTLTSAQLNLLFTAGPQVIGGVEIVPCGIQTGSGTYASWNTALGITAAQETTATTTCNAAGSGARLQENDGNGLKAKGDALVGKQVIVGFSAANFISQSNGVVTSQLPSPAGTVDLGAIDALGKPYTGTAPSLVPAAGFYDDATYGRTVYNVLPTSKVGGLASANQDIKSMFVGGASAVCSATSTLNAFGFLSVANCGAITLQGPLVA